MLFAFDNFVISYACLFVIEFHDLSSTYEFVTSFTPRNIDTRTNVDMAGLPSFIEAFITDSRDNLANYYIITQFTLFYFTILNHHLNTTSFDTYPFLKDKMVTYRDIHGNFTGQNGSHVDPIIFISLQL